MVSENEGAFLFKLSIMEGYKAPVTIEFCTVTMPFPRRRVVSFDGTPSIGTVSYTDHSVEWKIITNTRSVSGKSIEATFPGTVRFAPWQAQKMPSSGLALGSMTDEDSDLETESGGSMVNVEDYIMEKMSKDLQAVDLEEPFCWQAYNYAKTNSMTAGFFQDGRTFNVGMSIDPKSVSVFPAVKAPVEISTQVTSGDYILWNTLGKCPVAATPEIPHNLLVRWLAILEKLNGLWMHQFGAQYSRIQRRTVTCCSNALTQQAVLDTSTGLFDGDGLESDGKKGCFGLQGDGEGSTHCHATHRAVLASLVHHIWQKRNMRLFQQISRDSLIVASLVVACIVILHSLL
ncbi:UNVERIFIED_CONTAM: AP-5 complex subunit mu [Sesamum latifolium]|uniref:AP-5 complex subunit mu n=1 Tax=Sesamum latifolium TaxID=2727402 RepID=A0AAW2XTJ3_9LAMI